MGPIGISVLISCYNEQESILPTIETIAGALIRSGISWEIIVIDDASTDDSVATVRSFCAKNPDLPVRHVLHQNNQGFVRGIFEAVRAARGQYFWVVAGDNNVSQETALKLLAHVGKADIIIPRVLSYCGRSLQRRLISKTYALLVRALSGCQVTYYNGSSIHRRSDLLWLEDKVGSFAYAADCITRLLDSGSSFVEVPVIYNERNHGNSSALTARNLKDVAKFLFGLAIRRVKRVVQPRKIAVEKRELGRGVASGET